MFVVIEGILRNGLEEIFKLQLSVSPSVLITVLFRNVSELHAQFSGNYTQAIFIIQTYFQKTR